MGRTILRVVSSWYALRARVRYLEGNSGKVGLTWGILLTTVRPLAARSFFAWSMNGPRFSAAWPLTTVIADPRCPDSTVTIWVCNDRLAWVHSRAALGLATNLPIWLWMNPFTPLAIDPEVASSRFPARVAPCLSSAAAAWLTSACTSSREVIAVDSRSVTACCTDGSLMSGCTFATYRSVLDTWLAVHTPSTDSGASRHPRRISKVATGARHPNCRRRAAAAC